MTGSPSLPAPKPTPQKVEPEIDPKIEQAKQAELDRLAARTNQSKTIKTSSTQAGFLDESAPSLFKTTLGGA
jgi:hypothetical protein